MTPTDKPKTGFDVHGSIVRLGEMVARRCGVGHMWDAGLGDLVSTVVESTGAPKSVTAVDIAREMGIVPKGDAR